MSRPWKKSNHYCSLPYLFRWIRGLNSVLFQAKIIQTDKKRKPHTRRNWATRLHLTVFTIYKPSEMNEVMSVCSPNPNIKYTSYFVVEDGETLYTCFHSLFFLLKQLLEVVHFFWTDNKIKIKNLVLIPNEGEKKKAGGERNLVVGSVNNSSDVIKYNVQIFYSTKRSSCCLSRQGEGRIHECSL